MLSGGSEILMSRFDVSHKAYYLMMNRTNELTNATSHELMRLISHATFCKPRIIRHLLLAKKSLQLGCFAAFSVLYVFVSVHLGVNSVCI